MKLNKEKIKTGIWGGITGAIVVMIIGFGWGGWVLGSTAQKNADIMVADAVVARLVPMCVAQYNADGEKSKKFRELESANRWEREEYVEKQGWATMPYEKEPDRGVAVMCVELIMNGQ